MSSVQARPNAVLDNQPARGEATGEFDIVRADALQASIHESFARTMVAESLEVDTAPAFAIDRELSVHFANATFVLTTGLAVSPEGTPIRHLVGEQELASLRAAVERVRRGSRESIILHFASAAGSASRITFRIQLVRVGAYDLFTLRAAQVQLLSPPTVRAAYGGRTYAVEQTPNGLRIHHGTHGEEAYCHAVQASQPSVCSGCPVPAALASGAPRTGVCPSPLSPDRMRLVRARPASATVASVESIELEDADVSRMVAARIEREATARGLSSRERSVLECLLLGRSLDDIALMLGISRHTAKFHQANILAKLGAESRADLVRILL